ncbi:hypothetical protein AB1Y20_004700 [Prymnesium parvum]|uniref:DDT domain-containing protein n=1 Tax=Prymnesium parvum TaxID=97485 RepID=A0AB34IZ38_PRYPA
MPDSEDLDAAELHEIRQRWELMAFVHFHLVIGPTMKFPKLTTEEIEERLLDPSRLHDLLVPLLGVKQASASEQHDACWKAIHRALEAEELELPFPLDGETCDFSSLAPSERVQLLLALAEYRVVAVAEKLPTLHGQGMVEAASLRPERLGSDSDGRVYWFVGDGRLYREEVGHGAVRARRERPPKDFAWEVVACRGSEWREAAARLKKRGVEAALRQEVEARLGAVEAREAKLEREAKRVKVLEGPRRLSSRVQEVELKRIEAERQQKERERKRALHERLRAEVGRLSDEALELETAELLALLDPAQVRLHGEEVVEELVEEELHARAQQRRREQREQERQAEKERKEREAAEEAERKLAAEAAAAEARREQRREAEAARRAAEAARREAEAAARQAAARQAPLHAYRAMQLQQLQQLHASRQLAAQWPAQLLRQAAAARAEPPPPLAAPYGAAPPYGAALPYGERQLSQGGAPRAQHPLLPPGGVSPVDGQPCQQM